jgi:hypothetical protein
VESATPQREYKIDTRLVVRESTGYPRGAMQDLHEPKPQGMRASIEPGSRH